ncbi:hypothetical protein Hypma_016173 [Hypsizygus marmoreus]|uniref:Uncharacterized protein n=1 Tax=Hypsizygus marmoreus TaxID=39966 RepID=A0A369J5L3_HYPMA|nr:hypothetical protein Hypma_016173 [Hypsizygus marmoreus]
MYSPAFSLQRSCQPPMLITYSPLTRSPIGTLNRRTRPGYLSLSTSLTLPFCHDSDLDSLIGVGSSPFFESPTPFNDATEADDPRELTNMVRPTTSRFECMQVSPSLIAMRRTCTLMIVYSMHRNVSRLSSIAIRVLTHSESFEEIKTAMTLSVLVLRTESLQVHSLHVVLMRFFTRSFFCS